MLGRRGIDSLHWTLSQEPAGRTIQREMGCPEFNPEFLWNGNGPL